MATEINHTKYVSELTDEMREQEYEKIVIYCAAMPIWVNGKIVEFTIRPLDRKDNIGNGAGQAIIVKNNQ